MMLLDGFYNILNSESTESSLHAIIQLNKDHSILKGHFPDQPVVPGVCMLQIVKELTEKQFAQRFRIVESDNIKFLSVMDPNKNPQTNVSISFTRTTDGLSINASLHSGEITFFKIKATLKPE